MKEPVEARQIGYDSGSEPPGALASKVRYQVLAFACALAIVTYVQRLGFTNGGAPKIKESLGFNDQQIGHLMAAWLIGYGLFQVPSGLLGDRLGGRHVLTALVFAWSVVSGAVALVYWWPAGKEGKFAFLLVLRFLFGMLQAGGFPALGRVMADWMPITERGFAQGSIWMLSRWGGAFVPFVMFWLFDRFGNWPVPFVLIGCLGILWCGAFWPWFRNRPEQMRRVNLCERELIAAGRSGLIEQPHSVPWSRMARSRSVWSICLLYGCGGFVGNFFTSMLANYLIDQRHLDQHVAKWLIALPLAAGSAACILGGSASDWLIRHWGNRRWSRRIVGMLGFTLAGTAFLSVNGATETWQVGLLLTLSFFGNDLSMGPAWAACADIGERYAGTLSGAMNMVGALAGAAGTMITGYWFGLKRPELVFSVFAGVYGLAALCWLGVDVTRRLGSESEIPSLEDRRESR